MSNNTSIVRYDLEKGQNSVVNPHIEEPETKQSWVTALPGLINTAANITSSLSQGSGKGKDLSSLNKAIDDLITMREQGIPQEQMVLAEKETTASLLKQGYTYTDLDAAYKFKGYEGYADISRKALQEESNIVAAQDTIASQVGAGLIGPGATLKEQRQAGLDYLANLDKSLATTEEIKNAQGQEAKAEAVNNNLRVLYKNAADTASIVLNKQGYSLDNYIAVKQQWCADLVQKTGIEMQAAYTIFDRATFNTKSVVTSNIQSVEEMSKAVATSNRWTTDRKIQSFLSMPLEYVDPSTNEKTITDGATFLAVSEKIPLESLKVLMGVPMGQKLLANLLNVGTVASEFAPAMYQNLATTGQAWSIGSNPTMTNNIVNSFTAGQEQIAKEAATASTNELLSNAGVVSVDKFNTLFNNISKEQINSKDYEGVLQQREQIRNKAVVAATTSLGKITKGAATLIDEFGNVRLFSGDTEGNLVDITDKKEDFFNVGGAISAKAFAGTVAGIRMMSYNMQKLGYSQEEFRDFFNTMSAISSQDFRVAKAGRGNPFLGGEDDGSVLSIDEARQFVKEALSGKRTVNLNALYDSPKEKGLGYLTESFEEESNKQMNRALAEGPNRVTQEDVEDLPEDDGVVTTDTAEFLTSTTQSEEVAEGSEDTTEEYNSAANEIAKLYRTSGAIEEGNIDVLNRPVIKNKDGSVSTLKSITVDMNGSYVVLPTIINGKEVSDDEAINEYYNNPEHPHLGIFETQGQADKFAQDLSNILGDYYENSYPYQEAFELVKQQESRGNEKNLFVNEKDSSEGSYLYVDATGNVTLKNGLNSDVHPEIQEEITRQTGEDYKKIAKDLKASWAELNKNKKKGEPNKPFFSKKYIIKDEGVIRDAEKDILKERVETAFKNNKIYKTFYDNNKIPSEIKSAFISGVYNTAFGNTVKNGMSLILKNNKSREGWLKLTKGFVYNTSKDGREITGRGWHMLKEVNKYLSKNKIKPITEKEAKDLLKK